MSLREMQTKKLGDNLNQQLIKMLDEDIAQKSAVNRDYSKLSEDELFTFAEYDEWTVNVVDTPIILIGVLPSKFS